jgi:hypothetical protein
MTDGERTGDAQADRARDGAAAPGVGEALRLLGEDGRAGLRAARDTLQALRILVTADFALARGALARALVCAGVAVAFGGSAWLLLMATLIAALQATGLSWLVSLLLAALLSIATTAIAALAAVRYFGHTGMHASRRQLARLGLSALDDLMRGFDEDDERKSATPAPPQPDDGADATTRPPQEPQP